MKVGGEGGLGEGRRVSEGGCIGVGEYSDDHHLWTAMGLDWAWGFAVVFHVLSLAPSTGTGSTWSREREREREREVEGEREREGEEGEGEGGGGWQRRKAGRMGGREEQTQPAVAEHIIIQ